MHAFSGHIVYSVCTYKYYYYYYHHFFFKCRNIFRSVFRIYGPCATSSSSSSNVCISEGASAHENYRPPTQRRGKQEGSTARAPRISGTLILVPSMLLARNGLRAVKLPCGRLRNFKCNYNPPPRASATAAAAATTFITLQFESLLPLSEAR